MNLHPILLTSVGCLLVGLACSTTPDDGVIDVTYDPCEPLVLEPAGDTTQAELASLDDAIVMWNELAGARITRQPLPGAARLPVRFEEAALAFRGFYDDEQGLLLVNRNLADRHDLALTVAHELGHAFGLFHVESASRDSVMNPGNLTYAPNEGDLAILREAWGTCGPAVVGTRASALR